MTCKLTAADGSTYGGTQWGPGVTHEAAPGDGPLCSKHWIHVYDHPLVAVLMDPLHGDFGPDALLWQVEVGGETKDDHGLTQGVKRCTTVKVIEKPVLTTAQRVRTAILLAYDGCGSRAWRCWANCWLSGEDRSEAAAREVRAWVAAAEASSAAWAAEEEARAASAALKVWAADAAACAAEAAAWAAWAAKEAAAAVRPLDLVSVIERAIREESA